MNSWKETILSDAISVGNIGAHDTWDIYLRKFQQLPEMSAGNIHLSALALYFRLNINVMFINPHDERHSDCPMEVLVLKLPEGEKVQSDDVIDCDWFCAVLCGFGC